MSRKPTAVTVSKSPRPQPIEDVDPVVESDAPKGANQKTKKSSEQSRKPRAAKAPKIERSDDALANSETVPGSVTGMGDFGGRRLGVLFVTCLIALATLGIGLWFTQIVEDLFLRTEWLGWTAAGLLAVALFCLVIICLREVLALWRLRKLARLRSQVMKALNDDAVKSKDILDQIAALYVNRKEMHWHLSRLASHRDDVMDDRDRLLLAERYLMKPLDEEARSIITGAAKKVSIVTAVNPAPSLDVLFTGYQVLSMLRRITALYGNRPGSVGTLRLAGMVGSHLAVTGGLALSDTLIQQFVGKGLAGKISAKLGEGTVNGIMTARIGIAAQELCRPMPFQEIARPGLKEFISAVAGSIGSAGKTKAPDG